MAVILALGSLGIGYALWYDDITIEGSVSTGSLDLIIDEYSDTYLYKDIAAQVAIIDDDPDTYGNCDDPPCLANAGYILVAKAEVDRTLSTPATYYVAAWGEEPAQEMVVMNFDNICPTDPATPLKADVVIHYVGTIPAHIYYWDEVLGDVDLVTIFTQKWTYYPNDGTGASYVVGAIGSPYATVEDIQLHNSDRLHLDVYVEPDALQNLQQYGMGLSLTFQKYLQVYQWNEDPGNPALNPFD
jgi:hypothetical protein